MVKKFTLLLVAVAVLALAVPSLASASKMTSTAGVLTPVGTKLTLTGSDIVQKSNLLGTITCATLNLNAELTKNDGSTFEIKGSTSSPTQSGCVNGTKANKVTSFEISELSATTVGSVSFSFKEVEDTGSELNCTFTGTKMAGTYIVGSSVLKFSEASGGTSTPAACGSFKLSGEFKVEQTATGAAVLLD